MPHFDVFLCHNSADKPAVKAIGKSLKDAGLNPWLDEWELQPGQPWQDQLQAQIEDIGAAAVFVGKDGEGPWQKLEIQAFLQQFVDRKCPVIPVILPDYPKDKAPKLPPFLALFTWVDFRKDDPDPLSQLIWGITGKKGGGGKVSWPSSGSSPTDTSAKGRSPWRRRISVSLVLGLAGILATLETWRWPWPEEGPQQVDEARIRGRVVDGKDHGLAGVSVSVWGYESVVTGDDGIFELEAHRARGEMVRLHAERDDAVKEVDCYAGSDLCEIRLLSD